MSARYQTCLKGWIEVVRLSKECTSMLESDTSSHALAEPTCKVSTRHKQMAVLQRERCTYFVVSCQEGASVERMNDYQGSLIASLLVSRLLLTYSAISRILNHRASRDSTLYLAAETQSAARHRDSLRVPIANPFVGHQAVTYPT